ncbi:MAG: nitroreductase/quinone reductase family protein [Tepidiformaceae bacterium]
MQLDELAREQYCYLTTTGRVTGEPREIEIWFALAPLDREDSKRSTLYMVAGGGLAANWVRNLRKTPRCVVRIDSETLGGVARALSPGEPEDALARRLLFEKYSPGYSGSLEGWARDGLPIAIDLEPG